jgi:hypothetical protein
MEGWGWGYADSPHQLKMPMNQGNLNFFNMQIRFAEFKARD